MRVVPKRRRTKLADRSTLPTDFATEVAEGRGVLSRLAGASSRFGLSDEWYSVRHGVASLMHFQTGSGVVRVRPAYGAVAFRYQSASSRATRFAFGSLIFICASTRTPLTFRA